MFAVFNQDGGGGLFELLPVAFVDFYAVLQAALVGEHQLHGVDVRGVGHVDVAEVEVLPRQGEVQVLAVFINQCGVFIGDEQIGCCATAIQNIAGFACVSAIAPTRFAGNAGLGEP